jgi:hypothetical protein
MLGDAFCPFVWLVYFVVGRGKKTTKNAKYTKDRKEGIEGGGNGGWRPGDGLTGFD